MSPVHPESVYATRPAALERAVCKQKIRVALAALQRISIDSESLSDDAIYMLKELAESRDELELEPDALACAIISRESRRLEQFALAAIPAKG